MMKRLVGFKKSSYLSLGFWLIALSSLVGCNEIDIDDISFSGSDSLKIAQSSEAQGPVPFNQTANMEIEITNNSSSTLTDIQIQSIDEPFANSSFSCPSSLSAGQSCSGSLEFHSPGEGVFTAKVDISHSDGYSRGSFTFEGVALSLSLEKIYPNNSDWSFYVERDDFGGTIINSGDALLNHFAQDDTTCNLTASGFHSRCIHGAEKLALRLPDNISCGDSLTVRDELDLMEWTCRDIDLNQDGTSNSHILSTGLKKDRRLEDFIDLSDLRWKPNRILVKKSEKPYTIMKTSLSPWYSNAIEPLPFNDTNRLQLANQGTVYVALQSGESAGYEIANKNISVVIPRNLILKQSGFTTGIPLIEIASGGDMSWIEGQFNGNNSSESLIEMNGSSYNKVQNITGEAAGGSCITLVNSYSNFIHKVRCYTGLLTPRGGAVGLLGGTSFNVVSQISSWSSLFPAVYFMNTNNVGNTISGVVAFGSSNPLITLDNSFDSQNSFSHMTLMGGGHTGFHIDEAVQTSINQLVTMNQNQSGLTAFTSANNIRLSQIVSAHNSNSVMNLNFASGVNHLHNLLIGNNQNNSCSGGDGVGSACNAIGLSTHSLITGVDLSDSFVGKLNSPDLINRSNNPAELFGSIIDFIGFENPFRGWAKDGSAFPSMDQRGLCSAGDICRQWDLRLKASDSSLLNRSYDGFNKNEDFLDGAACPEAVHGDKISKDGQGNDYLVNAQELLLDSIGNDDGLCNEQEKCVYSPNYGAYQGHGTIDLTRACNFEDGQITGVIMHAFEQNGV